MPWTGHHPQHHHFNSDTFPSASAFLWSILDSSECACCFKYQLDSAVQRWSCRLKRCIADDVRAAFLRDITVLHHVLQLAQRGRARHPDCVCDLLSCQSVTTQRSRPQSSHYVRELSKRGYVVRAEDTGNQQALELLCGISQDQPFLPAWDVFRSHRLGELHFSVEAQDVEAPGAPACRSDAMSLLALRGRAYASTIRSVIRDQADVKCSSRAFPLLTQTGHWLAFIQLCSRSVQLTKGW